MVCRWAPYPSTGPTGPQSDPHFSLILNVYFRISTHYMYSKDIYRLEQDYIEGRDGRGKDPTPLLPPPV